TRRPPRESLDPAVVDFVDHFARELRVARDRLSFQPPPATIRHAQLPGQAPPSFEEWLDTRLAALDMHIVSLAQRSRHAHGLHCWALMAPRLDELPFLERLGRPGSAADLELIGIIHDGPASGLSSFGSILERRALLSPAACAVRWRSKLLGDITKPQM